MSSFTCIESIFQLAIFKTTKVLEKKSDKVANFVRHGILAWMLRLVKLTHKLFTFNVSRNH